jgi:putative copper resistance protein D
MIDVGLIVARLLHYAAVTALAGVSFFPFYAYEGTEPQALARWRRRLLLAAAIVALLSGLFWFVFAVAGMSGALTDLTDPEVVWAVVQDTAFGAVWTARMLLAVIIVGLTATRLFSTRTINQDLITSILAAALLASLAGTGHSQIEEGWPNAAHVASDAAHLLAAGAWLGGLLPFGFILFLHAGEIEAAGPMDLDQILLRFSQMGYVAVATLIGTGLVNSWFLVGAVSSLWTTAYGKMLIAKLLLFGGMLALAVLNRFWLVPSTIKARTDDLGGFVSWTGRLRTHVRGEQLLGLMLLLIVSVLGTMRPAIGH